MKRILVTILVLTAATTLFSQNLIGYSKAEIITIMKEEHKKFRLSTTTKNPVYNYLKYENGLKTETLLFFLSEKDECTYYKFLGDYSRLNSKISELNENHKKVDEFTWIEEIKGKKYNIVLEKGEWFFTLTTRKAEK